jgi:tetratricopeptide (TPR) repeat protein
MTKTFCPTVQERTLEPKSLRLADAVNIADCDIKAGKHQKALEYLDKLRSVFEAEADALYLGKFHLYRGLALYGLKDFQGALDEAETSLFLYEGDELRRGIAFNNIGNALIGLERISEANEYLDLAARIFTELKNDGCLGANLECRARALLHAGDCTGAIKTVSASLCLLANGIETTPLEESGATLSLCVLGLKIKSALLESGGSVPKAARLLGYTDRQALDYQLHKYFPFFESLGLVKRRGK